MASDPETTLGPVAWLMLPLFAFMTLLCAAILSPDFNATLLQAGITSFWNDWFLVEFFTGKTL